MTEIERQVLMEEHGRLRRNVEGLTEDTQGIYAFKLISDKIEKLEKDLSKLTETHQVVCEHYDLAFKFFADRENITVIEIIGEFDEWINKNKERL